MKIKISKFSCIEEATIELAALTILIGPQASGKSVISKLIYFFNNVLMLRPNFVEEIPFYDDFKNEISAEFRKWFPPSAWGSQRFFIIFLAGPIEIKIERRGNRNSEKLTIGFSEYFVQEYESMTAEYGTLLKTIDQTTKEPSPSKSNFDAFWRSRSNFRRKLEKSLLDEYVEHQLFIPAGRSLFTSIGKTIAAFEHGGMLDPVTIDFGRIFSFAREQGGRRYLFNRGREKADNLREQLTDEFFGGEIKFERDQQYVSANDGRKIPFSILSSGQQELLPLWLTLEYFSAFDDKKQFLYVEEPEAHLFPVAQSAIIQYLVRIVTQKKAGNRLVVTTHSPYILSKVNNLLKAGGLGSIRSGKFASRVDKIIPRDSWLRRGSTNAYAIVDRRPVEIMDKTGLIDGEYIDKVSEQISNEFMQLLEIEIDQ